MARAALNCSPVKLPGFEDLHFGTILPGQQGHLQAGPRPPHTYCILQCFLFYYLNLLVQRRWGGRELVCVDDDDEDGDDDDDDDDDDGYDGDDDDEPPHVRLEGRRER